MKHVLTSAMIVLTGVTALADPFPAGIPDQARPAYVYLKSVLSNDLTAFKNAHAKVALGAYDKAGGISNLFEKAKTELPKEFKNAALKDFTFTAERQTHASPGSPIELDGEYYMVMMNVEDVGGMGVFVEKEDSEWKITIPKYKNLDAVMKMQKAKVDEASNKASDATSETAPGAASSAHQR
jgi:hypothetical protein